MKKKGGYKKNFFLLVSNSGLNIHSYSPSRWYTPFCSQRSFNVNLGPNSCNPTFSVSLNTYRCRRTKMKSRWLWNVMTCLPWNSGTWGNKAWNMRPTVCPSLVLKLFNINSGLCAVTLPWFYVSLDDIFLYDLHNTYYNGLWRNITWQLEISSGAIRQVN